MIIFRETTITTVDRTQQILRTVVGGNQQTLFESSIELSRVSLEQLLQSLDETEAAVKNVFMTMNEINNYRPNWKPTSLPTFFLREESTIIRRVHGILILQRARAQSIQIVASMPSNQWQITYPPDRTYTLLEMATAVASMKSGLDTLSDDQAIGSSRPLQA